MITAHVAMDALSKKLRELQAETGRDGRRLITDAMKGALRKGMELTPPGRPGVQGAAAKKRGEAKLGGDVRRVFATAAYAASTIKDRRPRRAFLALMRRGDFRGAEKVLQERTWNAMLKQARLSRSIDEAAHDRARRRGRVPKKNQVAQILPTKAPITAYIRTAARRVGVWAAGWLPAMLKLKVARIPAWVRRNADAARGTVVMQQSGDRFTITAANKTGFGPLNRILPYAIAAATAGMDAQLRRFKANAIKKAGLNPR